MDIWYVILPLLQVFSLLILLVVLWLFIRMSNDVKHIRLMFEHYHEDWMKEKAKASSRKNESSEK